METKKTPASTGTKLSEDQLAAGGWEAHRDFAAPNLAGLTGLGDSASDGGDVGAGTALAMEILKQLLASMSGGSEHLAIGINNHTAHPLHSPEIYLRSGHSVDCTLEIGGGKAGFMTAQSKFGIDGSYGVSAFTFGVNKLAIMWGIPWSGPYENWFKVSVVSSSTAVDKHLWWDMYYNGGKTPGEAKSAAGGHGSWVSSDRWETQGVMGTASKSTLNVSLRDRLG